MVRKHQRKKHCVSANCHNEADVEYLHGTDELTKQRVEQHHGDNLDSTAESIEQYIICIPACATDIIFKEIDQQV